MTKEHKKNYCKRANKSKLSLKRSQCIHFSFTSRFLCLRLHQISILRVKLSCEASSVIWRFGRSPAIPTTPRLSFSLLGWSVALQTHKVLMERLAEVSPPRLLWRGSSSSCPVLHWAQAPAECFGTLSKMENVGATDQNHGRF